MDIYKIGISWNGHMLDVLYNNDTASQSSRHSTILMAKQYSVAIVLMSSLLPHRIHLKVFESMQKLRNFRKDKCIEWEYRHTNILNYLNQNTPYIYIELHVYIQIITNWSILPQENIQQHRMNSIQRKNVLSHIADGKWMVRDDSGALSARLRQSGFSGCENINGQTDRVMWVLADIMKLVIQSNAMVTKDHKDRINLFSISHETILGFTQKTSNNV